MGTFPQSFEVLISFSMGFSIIVVFELIYFCHPELDCEGSASNKSTLVDASQTQHDTMTGFQKHGCTSRPSVIFAFP